MKKELFSHFVYINSFFKTSELKISTNRYLEVNELSAIRSAQHRFDLTADDIEIKVSDLNNNINYFIPAFLFGSLFTSTLQIITNNLGYLLPLLSSFLLIMSFIFRKNSDKTTKQCSLYKTDDQIMLYSFIFDPESSSDNDIKGFVDQLLIASSKEEYDQPVARNIDFHCSTEDQYNDLTYHLESLYNSGIIDDTLFSRIEKNINEILYPHEFKDEKQTAEVIYLHNF